MVTTVAWRQTDLEDVGPEGGVGELEDVAGPHQVEPRLVLVHRVHNCLGENRLGKYCQKSNKTQGWGG